MMVGSGRENYDLSEKCYATIVGMENYHLHTLVQALVQASEERGSRLNIYKIKVMVISKNKTSIRTNIVLDGKF